jgi:hypothetical protein
MQRLRHEPQQQHVVLYEQQVQRQVAQLLVLVQESQLQVQNQLQPMHLHE